MSLLSLYVLTTKPLIPKSTKQRKHSFVVVYSLRKQRGEELVDIVELRIRGNAIGVSKLH